MPGPPRPQRRRKSTLIRSIVGRVIPDVGTISVFGAPADSMAARNALGWVPQELALYPRLSCRENLQAFGRYHGLSGAVLAHAVERCLGWATLADRSADLVKNLSGGMKRRLDMAAGLIHQPKLVLMDEPTVGVRKHGSIAVATSSLNSSAPCNAPLVLTISSSRDAICPAGSQ
jgi:ABC-2 type transport system ATP-binding protein